MARSVVPSVPIKLDRERKLRLDLNAMALIEERTGKNVFKAEFWQGITAADLRICLWACLVHEDSELTPEQVGAMIHPGNINEVSQALLKTVSASLPERDTAGGSSENPLTG